MHCIILDLLYALYSIRFILQIVSYTVLGDKGGFSASVRYSGQARHPTQNTDTVKTYQDLPPVTTPIPRYVKYIPHTAFKD